MLEILQLFFIRLVLRLPKGTPKNALRSETGLLAMKYRVWKPKFMLILHLKGLEDTSLAKTNPTSELNIKRGIINIHLKIRSLYNKISEVKNLVKQEKPHILGISEAELRKNHHNLSSLKVPGYNLILPKSRETHGKARGVVFIKKSLDYELLPELEHTKYLDKGRPQKH